MPKRAVTLGGIVHSWALSVVLMAQDAALWEAPDLRSSWLVALGHYQERASLYPPAAVMTALERRERCRREVERIRQAVAQLALWPQSGHLLQYTVTEACLKGARPDLRRGWRHEGPAAERARRVWGSEDQYRRAHELAWEILGVLLADEEILQQAVAAGVVDKAVLDWARAVRPAGTSPAREEGAGRPPGR